MRMWLKGLLWLSAVFVLVWFAVVIYWQSTSRLPSESDVVLYLGALPLGIAVVGWGLYKLVTRAPKDSQASEKSTANGMPSKDGSSVNAEHERGWTLNILATSLHTPVGATAAEVLAKIKEGEIEFELDPELKTPDGFPVFAARMPELDDAQTREALAQWQKQSAQPSLVWSDAQYRALHLASLCVSELTPLVAAHPEVQLYDKLKEEGRPRKEDAVPPLRVVVLWPTLWLDTHQMLASEWVKAQIVEKGWPGHRIVMSGVSLEHSSPLSVLDHINVSSHRAHLPTIGMLLASDSGIEQEYVDALASRNNLFSSKNALGARPGELAAGLLFADDKQRELLGVAEYSTLHRASWASRDKSADEKGRISSDLLGKLIDLALETSKTEASKIQWISADNDHKPNRESELMETLVAKFPDMDPGEGVIRASQSCGSMRHVASAAALCLAHQCVVDEQLPVLCTSLHDPLLRAVVVLNIAVLKTPEESKV
jgi:hypothetical protein